MALVIAVFLKRSSCTAHCVSSLHAQLPWAFQLHSLHMFYFSKRSRPLFSLSSLSLLEKKFLRSIQGFSLFREHAIHITDDF